MLSLKWTFVLATRDPAIYLIIHCYRTFVFRFSRNSRWKRLGTRRGKICNGYVLFYPLQRPRKSGRRKISGAVKNLWKVINFSGDIRAARIWMWCVVWKIRPCQHVRIQKLTFPLTLNQTLLVEANRSSERSEWLRGGERRQKRTEKHNLKQNK